VTAHAPTRIDGAVVVICGASSGFGRGVAVGLAGRGAKLVLMARRQEVLVDLVVQLREAGGEAIAVPGDISREADVAALSQAAVEEFGRIDIWINNVGVGALGLFWQIPAADQGSMIDINLRGLVFGAHHALGLFVGQGRGTLINLGLLDSEVPLAGQATYAATKAAVASLGRSLNEELRLCGLSRSVRVSTILPSAADTPWWSHAANYTGQAPRTAGMEDPATVVDAIIEACRDPRDEVPVGPGMRAAERLRLVFPRSVPAGSAQEPSVAAPSSSDRLSGRMRAGDFADTTGQE
jgi:short-subunit dehydrogenase